MREIKFRAWDKVEWKMWDVYSMQHDLQFIQTQWIWNRKWGSNWKIIDFEVMQFTWLKDKNGKEIYEGDIIKDEKSKLFIVEVRFMLEEWKWTYTAIRPWEEKKTWLCIFIEVIWNIYENPELITN